MKKILTINDLKNIEKKLLEDLDKYCKENGLTYFLTYGTLIGAVRHKGFIPWDDDIDVIMPRNDYEKFIENFNCKNTDQCIRVCSHKLDSNYYLPIAKLIDNRTVLKEEADVEANIGVYIDIFPLDNLSDDYNKAVKRIKKGFNLNRKWLLKTISFDKNRSLCKNIILLLGKAFLKNKTLFELINDLDDFASEKKSKSFSNYVGVVCGISAGKPDRVFKKEWFEKTVPVQFENGIYPAPIGYDTLLRQQYGNYMELPPIEKQVTHHSFEAWYK